MPGSVPDDATSPDKSHGQSKNPWPTLGAGEMAGGDASSLTESTDGGAFLYRFSLFRLAAGFVLAASAASPLMISPESSVWSSKLVYGPP